MTQIDATNQNYFLYNLCVLSVCILARICS